MFRGSLDPAKIDVLQKHKELSANELDHAIQEYKKSHSPEAGKSSGDGMTDSAGRDDQKQATPYVGARFDDEADDPEGHKQRMEIERQAIDLIIEQEPTLKRTPENNPGFDLFAGESIEKAERWIEVKSMAGSWEDKPVRLSHTQFKYALKRREAYWLYVVEWATDTEQARVYRIQDPIGHTQTLTFDCGWREYAESSPSAASRFR